MSVPNIERSEVFEVSQWGVESTSAPGTAVPALNRLEAVGVKLSPTIESDRYRPFGNKYDTLMIPGKDWTAAEISGRLDYNNVIYPLSSVVASPTISTVGTNGRRHAFTSNSTLPDTQQPFTIESGSFVRAQRATGVVLSDFGLAFRRGSIEVSGSGIGRRFTDGTYMTGDAVYSVTIDPTVSGGTFTLTYSAQTTAAIDFDATATEVQAALVALSNIGPGDIRVTGGPGNVDPFIVTFTGSLGEGPQTLTGTFTGLTAAPGTSAVASVQTGVALSVKEALPVIPGNVNIYADDTFAGIGTTKLTRVFEADFNIASRINPMWVLDSTQTSFAATVENAPDVTMRLKVAANGQGMAFLETLRASETVYLRIEVEGPAMPTPDTAENYLFVLDMAGKIESPDSFDAMDGAMSVDWTFRAVDDADFGGAFSIAVQNLVTAL
jgi:hypothetical protein